MPFEFHPYAPIVPQILAQFFVLITFIYLFWKYRRDGLAVVLILLCYERVFLFFGSSMTDIYKATILLLVGYVFLQQKAWNFYSNKDKWIIIIFIIFSIQFIVANFIYSKTLLTTIFSQYARYLETVMLWFLIKKAIFTRENPRDILILFYEIVLMAMCISIIQWLMLGSHIEGLVAGFTINGGSHGTTIPILGFIILWILRGGKFNKYDWLYVAGLVLIGFTAAKRAVMFILPIVIGVFMIYVARRRVNRTFVLGILAVPIVFYIGVRLTPTLNPDNKVWGRFDMEHIWDYAERYQFGQDGVEGQMAIIQSDDTKYFNTINKDKKIEAEGRGGATIALLKLIFGSYPMTNQDLYGIGYNNMYGVDYAEFDKLPLTIHLNHKGSASGLFQSYVTVGVSGVFTAVLFLFVFLFYCKFKRLRIVLFLIVFWEYFFYTGLIIRTPAFMAMIFAAIHYTNFLYYKQEQQKRYL